MGFVSMATKFADKFILKSSAISPKTPDSLRNISDAIVPRLRAALAMRELRRGDAIDIRGVDPARHVALLAVGGYNSVWLVELHRRLGVSCNAYHLPNTYTYLQAKTRLSREIRPRQPPYMLISLSSASPARMPSSPIKLQTRSHSGNSSPPCYHESQCPGSSCMRRRIVTTLHSSLKNTSMALI